MPRSLETMTARVLLAGLGVACCLAAQFTVSARPGLLNYFEGECSVNSSPVAVGQNPPLFLKANDTVSTGAGKAEVLLMPGVFLRLGDHSRMRMLSPSLFDTRLEILNGEAILEAVGLVRGSQVQIVDNNAQITITSNGLYRIRSGTTATAAVFQGSAEVVLAGEKRRLRRGHELELISPLKTVKLDMDQPDELYAWSNVRSQYEAAASFESAQALAAENRTVSGGWYFNDMFDSWTWICNGAFFSPFGWGYYSPVLAGGAVVVKCPVYRGGHWNGHPHPHPPGGVKLHPVGHDTWAGIATERAVPVNPKYPPVLGAVAMSPRVEHMERSDRTNGANLNWYVGHQLSANGQLRSPNATAPAERNSIFRHSNGHTSSASGRPFSRQAATHASSSGGGFAHHGFGSGGGGGNRGATSSARGSGGSYHGGGGTGGGSFHGGGGASSGGGSRGGGGSSNSSSGGSGGKK